MKHTSIAHLQKQIADSYQHCVYIVSDGSGCVKIGKASQLERRLRELQTANGNPLTLLASISVPSSEKAYALETYLHKLLKNSRANGEWFYVNKAQEKLRDCLVEPEISEGKCGDIGFGHIHMEPIAVSAAEAAELIGVSRPTIYKLINDGIIQIFHIGTRTLIPVDSLKSAVREMIMKAEK